MPNQTYGDRPPWGVDPQWGGPNMPGPAIGGPGGGAPQQAPAQGFNWGSYTIDPRVQAALDAIKHGNNRAQTTMERLFNMGLLQNGANINSDWIGQMLGQMPGQPGQFWGRVQRYMQSGELPRDYAGGGGEGGGGIPDNLAGAGASSGWQAGNAVDRDPFSGQLGQYIQGLIEDLKGHHGLPENVLANLYNQAATTGKNRERDRLMRRGDESAAAGLFGSGLNNRAMQDIEQQESGALQSAKTDIGYANAQAAVQQINQLLSALQMATGRELGLGNLDLGYGNLGLGYDQLDLSRELGQGNLTLGQANLALQAAMQEWLQNIGIFGMF